MQGVPTLRNKLATQNMTDGTALIRRNSHSLKASAQSCAIKNQRPRYHLSYQLKVQHWFCLGKSNPILLQTASLQKGPTSTPAGTEGSSMPVKTQRYHTLDTCHQEHSQLTSLDKIDQPLFPTLALRLATSGLLKPILRQGTSQATSLTTELSLQNALSTPTSSTFIPTGGTMWLQAETADEKEVLHFKISQQWEGLLEAIAFLICLICKS